MGSWLAPDQLDLESTNEQYFVSLAPFNMVSCPHLHIIALHESKPEMGYSGRKVPPFLYFCLEQMVVWVILVLVP